MNAETSQMKTVRLLTLDRIPALGLGTWKLSGGTAYEAVARAIDIGYRHFDCAWIYANESDVGRALKDAVESGKVAREELWITSKLWNTRHQDSHVQPALEGTLADLKLDYLDLYLMHWPVALKPHVELPESGDDFYTLEEVPLLETWGAMERCAELGLCRNIGVSNFNVPKIQHLIDGGSVVPAVNQVESHPYLQQPDLVEFCKNNGIGYTAYSPLGSADRPDRLRKDKEPSLMDHPLLLEIATAHGASVAQVMIAWAIRRDTIVIPKATSAEHLSSNFHAAAIELSDAQMSSIAEIDMSYRFIDGTFWEILGSGYTAHELWNE